MKKKTFIVQLLNSKKPSRTSFTQVEDANFYSNDTDASLVFIPHEDTFDFETAKVVMFNRGDESLVERDAVVTTENGRKVASYELPEEIIAHWGEWIAQPVFINGGEIYSGAIVPFSVERHLMHDRPPKLTEVVTVTKFVEQSQELVNAMIQAEAQRITEEQARQSAEEVRVQAESERSGKYGSYAQQFNDVITELSAEKDYHSLPEIAGARGGHDTLGARLYENDVQLAQTMTQAEFDSWVATLLDGGPSIFFDTLVALNTAYPQGTDGVALVRETDPAHIYVWNGTNWVDFGTYQGLEIKDNTVSLDKTTFAEKGKNLFDKDSPNIRIDGFVGSSTPNPLYNTSDYIRIYEGVPYTISHVRKYELINLDKSWESRWWSTTYDGYTPVTFVSDRDGYLSVSYYKDTTDALQVEVGEESTTYEPYPTVKIPNLTIEKSNLSDGIMDVINKPNESVLYGKKLLNFGDSISTPDFGYHEIIAEKHNMTLRDLGAGGYTVVKRDGYEIDIINRVNTAISEGVFDYDYILFNGLTNDANVLDVSLKGEITQGYDDPLDLYTFAGAFENLVKTLILNWPNSKIIYIRPHNMDSRNSRQITYGEMALEICRKWAIPYVDMYNEGGLNTQIPLLKTMYTLNADGTHPNEDGYRMFYVPRIEAKMKSV